MTNKNIKKYLTLEEWKDIAEKERIIKNKQYLFYNPKLNKKRFFFGLSLFVVGILPLIPTGLIGLNIIIFSLPLPVINMDKYLNKLRRLKYLIK